MAPSTPAALLLTALLALRLPALRAASSPFTCVFAPGGTVVNGSQLGLMTTRHFTGNWLTNGENVLPRAMAVFKGALMPGNASAVEVRVRFFTSPLELAGDCESPCVWDPFPSDQVRGDGVVEINLPADAWVDFVASYVTPYSAGRAGEGVCFTTGELIQCATNPAQPRSTVAWTSGAARAGYIDSCLSCSDIETYPLDCAAARRRGRLV